jgi:hypothetical protein
MPQTDVYVGANPKAGTIRPTVNHLIAQAGEVWLRYPKPAVLKSQDANYSAHE